MNRIAWLWICAMLTACQTPYREPGFGGGLSATQIDDSTLRMSGRANGFTESASDQRNAENSVVLELASLAIAPAMPQPDKRVAIYLEDSDGTYAVPVQINGVLTVRFTVDSGAAVVTIPVDVMRTLIRAGTVADKDMLEEKIYTLPDGSKLPAQNFRIGTLKVGDVVVQNVVGSVTPASGSLLLGQTFLRKLKSWSIDNERNMLFIER